MSIDKQLKGYWENEYFMIPISAGYSRCAAIRRGGDEEITPFGHEQLANTKAGAVQSAEPKPRRKPKKVETVEVVEEPDDFDLDEI